MMQAAAPVSVIAQASSSGKPKRASNARMVARVDAGAEAEAHLVLRSASPGGAEQHRRHHAEVVHDRGAAFAHALPPGAGMEAVELDDDAAGEDRRHRRERERVHVAERQRRDEALDVGPHRRQLAEAEVPLAGAQEVAVGEAAALGPPGGARRVEQRALGAAADRLAPPAAPASARRDPPGDLGPDRLQRLRRPAGRLAQAALAAAACATPGHLAVADQVPQLGRAHVLVDRHDADAERVERQPVGEERRPVLEQQADAVAGAVAGLRVGGAQPLDLAGDLAPAARAGLDAVGRGRDRLDREARRRRGARRRA